MSKLKASSISTDGDILKNSESLWIYLKKNAGIDSIFYDRDLLEGNASERGLYGLLGIPKYHDDFEQDLHHYSISVEQLLISFFKTLQPYTLMMSDICGFFERNMIKETNKSLKVVFNFDQAISAGLEFNLDHFRQILEKFTKVKRLINYFHLTHNELWNLIKVFSDDFRVSTKNPHARQWIDSYFKNEMIFGNPDIALQPTGNMKLDTQFRTVMNIWASFVSTCNSIGHKRQDFRKTISNLLNLKDHDISAMEATQPWAPEDLKVAESDFWPAILLECLFFKIDQLELVEGTEKVREKKILSDQIEEFLNKMPVKPVEEDQLLRELVDLLQLPVWKKRYELYAAWILTLIDMILAGYPHEFLPENEKLSLTFSATRLATIETENGSLELWSEVRSPVENPSGKGRKENIQPDYAIYYGQDHLPGNCVVVFEVKQYRKPGIANFTAALNDYTKGLPDAHVFLVNYGDAIDRKKLKLSSLERSHIFGQIKPSSEEISSFVAEVKNILPKPPLSIKITKNDAILLFGLTIDCLAVDISASLDNINYKSFLRKFLKDVTSMGRVIRLIAVDVAIRREWINPDESSAEELLNIHFDSATEFIRLLPNVGRLVIVTDRDGVQAIERAGTQALVIEYFSDQESEIKIYNS